MPTRIPLHLLSDAALADEWRYWLDKLSALSVPQPIYEELRDQCEAEMRWRYARRPTP